MYGNHCLTENPTPYDALVLAEVQTMDCGFAGAIRSQKRQTLVSDEGETLTDPQFLGLKAWEVCLAFILSVAFEENDWNDIKEDLLYKVDKEKVRLFQTFEVVLIERWYCRRVVRHQHCRRADCSIISIQANRLWSLE
nr:hypothetical protein [Tanacetum cinerariifolium]